jgi:hypothetical protein
MMTDSKNTHCSLLGLTGLAGAGKDLLFSEIAKFTTAKRLALADNLKMEMQEYLLKCFGIDILHATREQKESVRDLLVAHGKVRRKISKGRYWTSLITKETIKYRKECLTVITDIRYAKYPEDEHFWLKKMGGKLIHLKKFIINENEDLIPLKYPNIDEAENDPILLSLSDYQIEWPDMQTCPIQYKTKYEEKYQKELEKFFYWLKFGSK